MSFKKTCKRCGKIFELPREDDRAKYCNTCSDKRYLAAEHPTVTCALEGCENTFVRKNKNHRFCCPEHKDLYHSDLYKRKRNVTFKRCLFCESAFETRDSKKKYCSKECYDEAKLKRMRETRKAAKKRIK